MFLITGYPSRRTGTATLNVYLEDINDNSPRLVDPVVYIEENMPINSHTRPREIKAMDDDDNNVGHGPPFRMTPTNGSANSRDLRFVFHDGKCIAFNVRNLYQRYFIGSLLH